MIRPFKEIDITLLNDFSDSSYIELDDITIASVNILDDDDDSIQYRIHDTLSRIYRILVAYRDGRLIFKDE